MAEKKEKTITADEIKALLSKKYEPPVYAFFTEVGNGTGSNWNRYIDAVAFSLYPSMNHEIHGFEIKISRSDFLSEMNHPEKTAESMQYCDRWWLVAPKGVANKDELPKSWGFYEVVNGRLYKRKHAPELNPETSLSFIAALLRRSTEDSIPRSTLWHRIDSAKKEARKDYAKGIEESKNRLEEYKKKVSEFEEASGLKVFDIWDGGKELGEAVKFVLEGGLKIDYPTESAISSIERVLKELKAFDSIRKNIPKIKLN